MQQEKALEKQITKYCKDNSIDYIINKQQLRGKGGSWTGIGATKGILDMCVFINGKTLWIELKTQKGVLRKEQIQFMIMLATNKIIGYVVKSLDEFIRVIEVNL